MSSDNHTALKLLRHDSLSPAPPAPLTVKEKEIQGIVPRASLEDLFDGTLTREDVLARVDPDALCTGPVNLLVATAIALSSADSMEVTEDHVLRYREALTSQDLAAGGYVRLTAEKLVLADVEYQQAITKYAEVEATYPDRESYVRENVYVDACKIHERRMDRLLRARKECFDRYERAAEVYRVALLTRDGQEVLLSLATKTRPGVRLREHTGNSPNTNSGHILARSPLDEDTGVEVLTEDSVGGSSGVQVFIKVR